MERGRALMRSNRRGRWPFALFRGRVGSLSRISAEETPRARMSFTSKLLNGEAARPALHTRDVCVSGTEDLGELGLSHVWTFA